jgi:hypothetical protein
MNIDKELHFLNHNDASMLVDSISDLKHKTLILIMLDAGLRVSEAISLKFGNFDFKKQLLNVHSLKKRTKSKDFQTRQIPLSQRLFLCLADYAQQFATIDINTYLFPSPEGGHITRQAVFNYLKRLSFNKLNIQNLHPHALRHSFATSLVATGADLHKVADLLGHQCLDTSRIYTHIPKEQLSKAVAAASIKNGAKRRLFPFLYKKRTPIVYIPTQNITPIVGRNSELQTITEHLTKGTNILILGAAGVGKRLLLDNLKTPQKILTFDDSASIKKSLIYLLLYLYENDKEQVAKVLFSDFDRTKSETRLSRQSVGFLCDEIKRIVKPKEYVLKIKQFDDITKQSLKVIESLKDTFVLLTSANEISISKSSFFWNFEKIELKNLSRVHSFELIHKLSYDLDIDDYEIYRSHIWQQTDGNPKAITEMIERYRREPILIAETVRSITISGAVKEFDCTYIVIILIASLAIMRYMTSELDNPGLRVLGGIAMILLLITRSFASKTKRKFI